MADLTFHYISGCVHQAALIEMELLRDFTEDPRETIELDLDGDQSTVEGSDITFSGQIKGVRTIYFNLGKSSQ